MGHEDYEKFFCTFYPPTKLNQTTYRNWEQRGWKILIKYYDASTSYDHPKHITSLIKKQAESGGKYIIKIFNVVEPDQFRKQLEYSLRDVQVEYRIDLIFILH